MKALIRHIFVDEKAFRSCDAASQQFHKILLMDAADQVDFIKEMIHPLSCVEKQPLYGNDSTIW